MYQLFSSKNKELLALLETNQAIELIKREIIRTRNMSFLAGFMMVGARRPTCFSCGRNCALLALLPFLIFFIIQLTRKYCKINILK